MANTHSPTSIRSESPRRATVSPRGSFSSRTTATSVRASVPTTLAETSVPSHIVTVTFEAPSTTCRLVTTFPAVSMTTPEPVPRRIPSGGMPGPWPGSMSKKCLKMSGRSPCDGFPRPGRSRFATRGGADSTSMRTTLGRNALAAAAKADDRARAAAGFSILGVMAGAASAAGAAATGAAVASFRPMPSSTAPSGTTVTSVRKTARTDGFFKTDKADVDGRFFISFVEPSWWAFYSPMRSAAKPVEPAA